MPNTCSSFLHKEVCGKVTIQEKFSGLLSLFFLNRALGKKRKMCPHGLQDIVHAGGNSVWLGLLMEPLTKNSITPRLSECQANLDSRKRVCFFFPTLKKKKKGFQHYFCFQKEKRLILSGEKSCPNSGRFKWQRATASCNRACKWSALGRWQERQAMLLLGAN